MAAIGADTLGPDESVLLGFRDGVHVWRASVCALEQVPAASHVEVASDLDRLIALGVTRHWKDPKGRWTVLADPEGNPFCAMYQAP